MDALQFIENIQLNNAEASNNSLAQIATGNKSKEVEMKPSIFIIKDMHLFLTEKAVMRKLRDMKENYESDVKSCSNACRPVPNFPCLPKLKLSNRFLRWLR